MKTMIAFVIGSVALLAGGCSYVAYEGEFGKVTYFRGAQKLDLEIEKTDKGLRVRAQSDPTPALDVVGRAIERIPVVPVP
jgi:hypothetical protein